MKKPVILIGIVTVLGVAAAGISFYCFRDKITATDDEKAAVVKGNNEFALNLYTELAKSNKDKNLFFSPYSISSALAMTYAGARDETEKQMKDVLHFALEQERLHPAFYVSKRDFLAKSKRSIKLDIANALYMQTGKEFNRDFIQLAKRYYEAKLAQVDFEGNPAGAAAGINKWVKKKTRGKIPEIISPENISAETILVLLNAIYFKGEWESKFSKDQTQGEFFHFSDGTKKRIPMMHQTGNFKYKIDSFNSGSDAVPLHILEMPYKGKNTSMIIFMPEANFNLSLLEKETNEANLQKWISALDKEMKEIYIIIPKFTFDTYYSLKEHLQNLGMTNAFNNADFSGIRISPKGFFISFVIHKAYIEVDEEGTTAAAATAVGTVTYMVLNGFTADHPFIFIIRENTTGSILFMGRVMDPTKED